MKKFTLLSLSVFFLAGCTMGGISTEKARTISDDFIKTVLAPGADIKIKSLEKAAGGDFKVIVDAGEQEVISYLSPDGTIFYPQGLDIADLTIKAEEFAKKTTPVIEEETADEEADIEEELLTEDATGDEVKEIEEVMEEAEVVEEEVTTE